MALLTLLATLLASPGGAAASLAVEVGVANDPPRVVDAGLEPLRHRLWMEASDLNGAGDMVQAWFVLALLAGPLRIEAAPLEPGLTEVRFEAAWPDGAGAGGPVKVTGRAADAAGVVAAGVSWVAPPGVDAEGPFRAASRSMATLPDFMLVALAAVGGGLLAGLLATRDPRTGRLK